MRVTRPARGWVGASLLVVGLLVAALVTGWFWHPLMVSVGAEITGAPTTLPPSIFSPPPTPEVEPALGDGLIGPADPNGAGPPPDPGVLQQRLAALDTKALAAAAQKLQLGYQVLDAHTGEVLAEQAPTTPLIPASTTKLLTVTAALAVLDDTQRFPTTVVQPEPGRIVLLGGGDPMLLSVPPKAGTQPAPASLAELAAATADKLISAGQTSVSLSFDASLFTAAWNQTWPGNYRDQVTPISALWADEGRDASRVRSRDPALLAATTFAAQLTAAGVAVAGVPTPGQASGEEIARVESLPVHVLAEQAMLRSNNSFTEVLGRHVALATGHEATFAGAVAGIQEQLTELGIWSEGASLSDASGLSRSNRVTPSMLAAAMRRVASEPRLSVILDGLPVAGVTGTLANRFDDPVAAPARGVARAKTGTLSFVATLAGVATTRDGRDVVFSFMTNGSADGWAAKVWTDEGVGVVAGCGC